MKKIPQIRKETINALFSGIKPYRFQQIEEALFSSNAASWENITTLTKEMRKTLAQNVPFLSCKEDTIISNREKDTFKAALKLLDNCSIETVLMKNARSNWTVCLSTQAGCNVGCVFCATGDMGLVRSLNTDEIIDQYRFWVKFMKQKNIAGKITNLVFMGMGEPFLNYENTRDAIRLLLKYSDIGKTRITISTIGIIAKLEKILEDKLWPGVRIAVSLQSADYNTRKRLIPKIENNFYRKLNEWARKYFKKYSSRRNYLTIEYVMLKDTNDTDNELEKLINLVKKIDKVKVNLIPYNSTKNEFQKSDLKTIQKFKNDLEKNNIAVTIRESKGQDIKAACGQLAIKRK